MKYGLFTLLVALASFVSFGVAQEALDVGAVLQQLTETLPPCAVRPHVKAID